MDREQIIHLANKSGWPDSLVTTVIIDRLTDFAKLVAEHERGACAKACEDVHAGKYDSPEFWREGVAYTCAAAIRSRSN